METSPKASAIFFFDGVCHLCDHAVHFLLWIDRKKAFAVASLQGETAASLLPESLRASPGKDPDSLVLYLQDKDAPKILTRSDALLELCQILGGPWRLFRLFKILPRAWRDALYRVISKNRFRLFGRKAQCELPTLEEKARLLP
ncbi:MAG: DCC1-like thiol-disulfide oxidoreductase family protein [Verrucomicrobiota bacterium]